MTHHSKFSEAALKREDRSQKDLYIQLIDYSGLVAFREPTPDQAPFIVAADGSTSPETPQLRRVKHCQTSHVIYNV